jgi:hypothetical protein
LNELQTWLYYALVKDGGFSDYRDFHEKTTIEDSMIKLGYDGIIVRGREMVNFAPPPNVEYFADESQVISYWLRNIKKA